MDAGKEAQRVVAQLTRAKKYVQIRWMRVRVRALSCVLMRCVWLGYLPVRLSPRCCGHRKEGLGCCLLRMSPVRCGGCGPLAFQTIGDHYLPEREKVRMVIKIVRLAATRPRSIRSTRMERTFFFFSTLSFFRPCSFSRPDVGKRIPSLRSHVPLPRPPLLSTRYQPS